MVTTVHFRRAMAQAERITLASAPTVHQLSARSGQRRTAWTEADKTLGFKVKAEGVNMAKLAGGILRRCDQQLATNLEPMGAKSVYNSVIALVMVNRLLLQRRQNTESAQADSAADTPPWDPAFWRVGFMPSFARDENQVWMRLKVVSLGREPAAPPPGGADVEAVTLKASAQTDLRQLEKAIMTNWQQRCSGQAGDPRIAAMGGQSVSNAVKGAAFAFRALRHRRMGIRPFIIVPRIETTKGNQGTEEPRTITYLDMEQQPERGSLLR